MIEKPKNPDASDLRSCLINDLFFNTIFDQGVSQCQKHEAVFNHMPWFINQLPLRFYSTEIEIVFKKTGKFVPLLRFFLFTATHYCISS